MIVLKINKVSFYKLDIKIYLYFFLMIFSRIFMYDNNSFIIGIIIYYRRPASGTYFTLKMRDSSPPLMGRGATILF